MRLTNSNRQGIVDRAIAARFDPEFEAVVKDKQAMATKLYEMAYSSKVRQWAKQAPKGWLRSDECLRFNLSGHQVCLNVPDGLPVPFDHGFCGSHSITVADESLRDASVALDERETEIKKQRDRARSQLRAMLDRVTTLAKLKEVWPEGARFYDALTPRERIEVPALQVSDINTILGLAA